MGLKNTIILHNGYAEIICETKTYKHSTFIDIDDISKVGKVRISNTGYAYSALLNIPVASLVLGVVTNTSKYIDHLDGNSLNNVKANLRVCTPSENARNRHSFVRNNTGTVGISYRSNGKYEYYRVSLTDKRGVRFTKQFNINKLGKEIAFNNAKELLLLKKKEFGYIVM